MRPEVFGAEAFQAVLAFDLSGNQPRLAHLLACIDLIGDLLCIFLDGEYTVVQLLDSLPLLLIELDLVAFAAGILVPVVDLLLALVWYFLIGDVSLFVLLTLILTGKLHALLE